MPKTLLYSQLPAPCTPSNYFRDQLSPIHPRKAPVLPIHGTNTRADVQHALPAISQASHSKNVTAAVDRNTAAVTETMGILGFNFNLVEQLTFYGSYHSHPLNQLIHFIFVPALFWTALVWLAYTPTISHCDLSTYLTFLPAAIAAFSKYLVCNGTAVLVAGYSLYYVILAPVAGATWALFMGLPMWATANAFQQAIPHAWAWALGLHILSWAVQVHVGHTIVEKRRPALLDSFFQSLVLAPLFVWFEALFLLGYRSQLREEVAQGVARNIVAWKNASTPLMAEDEDQ